MPSNDVQMCGGGGEVFAESIGQYVKRDYLKSIVCAFKPAQPKWMKATRQQYITVYSVYKNISNAIAKLFTVTIANCDTL